MKVSLILVSIAGFLSGVLIHSLFFELTELHYFIAGIVLIPILSVLLVYSRILPIALLVFFLSYVGGYERFSFELTQANTRENMLQEFITDTGSEVAGTVVSEVLQGKKTQRFTVLVDSLDSREVKDFKLLVYVDPYSDIEYGDSVQMSAVLKKPENFITDTERTFDYVHYLMKDGVQHVTLYPHIKSISSSDALSVPQKITQYLYTFKSQLVDEIFRRLPQPESGLLAGILFGTKDALDEMSNEQFRNVGLMHIVVLSGYNVALVITLIMKLLYFLPLRARSVLAVCGIICFALLVGAGPTVIRASIMALFVVLSENVGRQYSVQRGLIVAGFIMVVVNPWVLMFDISFQLSFLATYGLITFSPFFEYWLRWIPTFLELRASAVATLSAQVIVTPILLYSIGDFSIISPLVNVLVLFAVPWAMLLGFIASFSFVPIFIAYIAYLPLRYITWVVEHLATVPFSVITVQPFNVVIMIGMYLLIIWWWMFIRKFEYMKQ